DAGDEGVHGDTVGRRVERQGGVALGRAAGPLLRAVEDRREGEQGRQAEVFQALQPQAARGWPRGAQAGALAAPAPECLAQGAEQRCEHGTNTSSIRKVGGRAGHRFRVTPGTGAGTSLSYLDATVTGSPSEISDRSPSMTASLPSNAS